MRDFMLTYRSEHVIVTPFGWEGSTYFPLLRPRQAVDRKGGLFLGLGFQVLEYSIGRLYRLDWDTATETSTRRKLTPRRPTVATLMITRKSGYVQKFDGIEGTKIQQGKTPIREFKSELFLPEVGVQERVGGGTERGGTTIIALAFIIYLTPAWRLTVANKIPRSDPLHLRPASRDHALSRLLSSCARTPSTRVCETRTIAGVCTVDWALRRSLWA